MGAKCFDPQKAMHAAGVIMAMITARDIARPRGWTLDESLPLTLVAGLIFFIIGGFVGARIETFRGWLVGFSAIALFGMGIVVWHYATR